MVQITIIMILNAIVRMVLIYPRSKIDEYSSLEMMNTLIERNGRYVA